MRIVIDTNVVLSATLFRQGRLAALRHTWTTGAIKPVIAQETRLELLRILGYSKFKLSALEIAQTAALYLPYAEMFVFPETKSSINIPICRDPKDQIFLELAYFSQADALISGDQDLLCLADVPLLQNKFQILSPQDFLLRFASQ